MKRVDIKKILKFEKLRNHLSNKNFFKGKKSTLISLATMCGMAIVLVFVMSFSDSNLKEDKLTPLDISYTVPDTSAQKGTSSNPFIFLEVVPKKEMSKMKYLFDPADIKSENKYLNNNVEIVDGHWKRISTLGDWVAYDRDLAATLISDRINIKNGTVSLKNIYSDDSDNGNGRKRNIFNNNDNRDSNKGEWYDPWGTWQWWRPQLKMAGKDMFTLKQGGKYRISFKYKLEGSSNNKFSYAVEALKGQKFKDPVTMGYDSNGGSKPQNVAAEKNNGQAVKVTYNKNGVDKDGFNSYEVEFNVNDYGFISNKEKDKKGRIVFGFGNSNANGNLTFKCKELKVEEYSENTSSGGDSSYTKYNYKDIYELEDKGIISSTRVNDITAYKYEDSDSNYNKESGYFEHIEDGGQYYNGGQGYEYADYMVYKKSDGTCLFRYVGDGNGNCKWRKNNQKPSGYDKPDGGTCTKYDDFMKKMYTKVYVNNYEIMNTNAQNQGGFKVYSNHFFRKYVLGQDTEEKRKKYYLNFYTVTPDELNGNFKTYGNDNKSIIDTADFIYSSDYSLDASEDNFNGFSGEGVANLRGDASTRIIKNVATKKTPLVLDYREGEYKNTKRDTKAQNKGLTVKQRAEYGFNACHDEQESLGFIGTKTEMYRLNIYTAIYGPSRFYNYFLNDYNGTMTPALHMAKKTGIPSNKNDVPNPEEFEDFDYDIRPVNKEENVKNYYTMDFVNTSSTCDYDRNSYQRYAFSDWHFIPSSGAALGMTTIEFQNLLGVVNGNLMVGNNDNHQDYYKSVLENVYFNLEDDNNRGKTSIKFINDYYTNSSGWTNGDWTKSFKDVLAKNSGNGYTSPIDNNKKKDLSSCSIYKYLLDYKNDHPINEKDEFNVLDVEPCNDFTEGKLKLKNEGYTKAFHGDSQASFSYKQEEDVDPWDPAKKQRIKNRYMDFFYHSMLVDYYGIVKDIKKTSSEFAGDNNDFITKYDTIYFGDNTGKFNKDSAGKIIYNDPSMDGRIYSHVGDSLIGGMRMSGLLGKKSDYSIDLNGAKGVKSALPNINTVKNHRTNDVDINSFTNSTNVLSAESYRLSGNDISNKVCNKLVEYVGAGYAVIAADKFKTCDETALDTTSYVYKFFNQVKSKSNVVASSTINDGSKENDLKTAVNRSKVNIILSDYPTPYKKDNNSTTYNSDGSTLKYKFKITENSSDNAKYKAYLIIDSDADGIYEKSEAVKTVDNLTKNTVNNLNVDCSESEVSGGLAWKLLVERTNNDNNRAEKTGYTCIKSSKKKQVKILQIMPDTKDENPRYSKDGDLKIEPNSNANRFNMQNGTDTFNKLKDIEEYSFNIKSTTVSSFVEYFLSHKTSKKALYQPVASDGALDNNDPNKFIPDKYDVVVLGFGDRYTDFYSAYNSRFEGLSESVINNAKKQAIINLQNYIGSKKALIYTHDVMSFINSDFSNYSSDSKKNSSKYYPLQQKGQYGGSNYDTEANWGYSVNKYLRARLGVDRFGITDDKKQIATYDSISSSYIEKQGFTNGALSYNLHDRKISSVYKDWLRLFDPSVKSMTTDEFASLSLKFFDASGDSSVSKTFSGKDADGLGYVSKVNRYSLNNMGDDFYKDNVTYTKKMTSVNDGMISHYPYDLNNTSLGGKKAIEITSSTHSPFYQMNLDNSNAVVWYCLAKNADNDLYSESPNDVRNYYGLYSVDNIYFCNIGQSNGSNIGNNEAEMKILVNTMLAASKNKKFGSEIDIHNSDGRGKDDDLTNVDVMYVYSDKHDSDHSLLSSAKNELQIDFTVYSLDGTDGKDVTLDVERKVNGEWKKDTEARIEDVEGSSGSFNIKTSTKYSLYVKANKHISSDNNYYYRLVAKNSNISATNIIKVVRRNIIDMND